VLPGAQVLFGFLLTVPFDGRFQEVDAIGQGLLVGSLLGVAAATVLFLTPAALHRRAPEAHRHDHVDAGGRFAVAGLCLLAVSMAAALTFVVRFIDGPIPGWLAGGAVGISAFVLWFVVPGLRRPT
jgi:hypothetical protein